MIQVVYDYLSIVYQLLWPNSYDGGFTTKGSWVRVSFWNSRFRSLQLEEAYANELKYDIHPANTLF